MILANFISAMTLITIYYLNLKHFHTSKTYSKLFTIAFIISCSLGVSLINQLKLPFLNLLVNLLVFFCISKVFFIYNRKREYITDFFAVVLLVILDALFYFIVVSFTSFIHVTLSDLFIVISCSIMFIVVNFIVNKLFNFTKIKKIPNKELILFIFILVFHIVIIAVFNLEVFSHDYMNLQIIALVTAIGIIFTDFLLAYYLNGLIDRYDLENEQIKKDTENELRRQYYDYLKEKYENQRKIAHDFKNHIQVISQAYESKNTKLAEEVISEVKGAYNNELLFNTGSEILNIIVNDKAKNAKENNIEFSFATELLDLSYIADFDMITLFGNLYDNAIEANLKISDERLIETKISKLNSMLIITVKNNYNNVLNYKNDQILSTKENHKGIGLNNIKEVVSKYDGMIDIDDKFGLFVVSIAIPIPS